MKYEYIPIPKSNRMKKIAIALFFGGLITVIVGAINVIPFRGAIQFCGVVLMTMSIMVMVKCVLKAYRYRIEDLGEGDELLVDEITRNACVTVCRLELSKLKSVKKWEECGKELRSKRRYSYCPDVLESGTYLIEFHESNYDNTAETIRIRLSPDEKLISIFNAYTAKNAEKYDME